MSPPAFTIARLQLNISSCIKPPDFTCCGALAAFHLLLMPLKTFAPQPLKRSKKPETSVKPLTSGLISKNVSEQTCLTGQGIPSTSR